MPDDNFAAFRATVNGMPRRRPLGNLARINEYSGILWAGHVLKTVYVGCDDDGSANFDEEFELVFGWENWRADFASWLENPKFDHWQEIEDWI